MGDMSPPSMNSSGSEIVSVSAKILILATVVIFFMMAFLFFIHIYAKWYWSREEDPATVSWRRRTARRGRAAAVSAQRRGLDPLTLRSLPAMVYDPKAFKDGLECAVCLSEVSEGEKIRLLPKCNHVFHVECIDMWFHSHSTCPLCRNSVVNPPNNSNDNNSSNGIELQDTGAYNSSSESDSDSDYDLPHSIEASAAAFPTNVLFWGDETQVRSLGPSSEEGSRQATNSTSSSSGSSSSTIGVGRPRDSLVIEIPRELCEDCLSSTSLPGAQFNEEDTKSPVMTRLRSLKRMLSRGKRVAPSPRGSSSADVDQV